MVQTIHISINVKVHAKRKINTLNSPGFQLNPFDSADNDVPSVN
jgi:hypothetical protein